MGSQTFEGQAAGTAFTVATSGTNGNSAYTTRTLGGGAMVYSNTAPLPAVGSMGLKITPATNASALVQRTVPSLTQHTARFYIGWAEGGAHNFYGLRNASAKVVGVQTNPSGVIALDTAASWTSSVTIAVNTMYRVEVAAEVGTTTTNGRVRVWIYSLAGALLDSFESTTANVGTAVLATEQVGKLGATAETGDIFLDDHAWSDTNSTTQIGPSIPNQQPTVTPAPNITGAEPGSTVTSSVIATDDGTIASYAATAPGLTLSGSGSSRSFVVPLSLTAQTYTITWTVTDNQGAQTTATQTVSALPCTVRVKAADGSMIPAILRVAK